MKSEGKAILTLEKINMDYIRIRESKEYNLGYRIIQFVNNLKKLKFKEIYSMIKKHRAEKTIMKKYPGKEIEDNKNYKEWISEIENINNDYKIAIYTCIIGEYDNIIDPLLDIQGVDYFIFSDRTIKSQKWHQYKIPKKVADLQNNTLINRYIKFHPFEFFSDYDFSIYIDGNVTIISDVTSMVKNALCEIGIAMHNHVNRFCIYDEAEVCILYGKGNTIKLKEQINNYRQQGFPKNYGMLEGTVIVSHIKNEKAKFLLDEWWKEFIKSGSMRDQIAWPYILWKNNIKCNDIGWLGNNVYRNPKFRIKSH